MEALISEAEARVLGCLIEKELTTPEYYPLTLKALTNACNQKNNRSPVVSFEEMAVVRALDGLRDKGLAIEARKFDSRVPKYQHLAGEKLALARREVAVLCELLLRGPQTVGEIKGRAERMYAFSGLSEAEESLEGLAALDPPLAVRLPRQPGRKESRYAHTLCGMPEIQEAAGPAPEAATLRVRAENEEISSLKEDMRALRAEVDALKEEFMKFREQFD